MDQRQMGNMLDTFPALLKMHREGIMPKFVEEAFIAAARQYAKRYDLAFDGTVVGALNVAEEADTVLRVNVELIRMAKGRKGIYKDIPRPDNPNLVM